MKKGEIIWREILERSPVNNVFEQIKLAKDFGFSTSTVHAAIAPLRAIGAVVVTRRNFRVTDFEKILLFWGTHRRLQKDICYQTHADLPVVEIEGLIDDKTIYGAYSAARNLLSSAPSDYGKVYVYAPNPAVLIKRFPPNKKEANFFVIKSDPFLANYGQTTPVSQTFVDLWNLSDWYATDFLKALKEKFYVKFLQ